MKRAGSGTSAGASSRKKRQPEPQVCNICQLPLPQGLLGQHAKCERNTILLPDLGLQFHRNSDKYFHCRDCTFKESDRDAFIEHVRTSHNAPAEDSDDEMPAGPPETPQEDADERSGTPDLEESSECKAFLAYHGLAIAARLLICIECKSVVDFTKVRKHFSKHHRALETKTSMQEDFEREVRRFHLDLIAQPIHPTHPIPRIPYLETRTSYMRCVSCNRCYQSPETYNLHNCLPGGKRGDVITYNCQRYVSNSSSPWFPIQKTIRTPGVARKANPFTIYLKQKGARDEEAMDGSQIDEVRILHQFLHKEGWIRIVSGTKLSRALLMEFGVVPLRDPTLIKLGSVIYGFLKKMQDCTPNNTIRRMIGIRPASEHEVSTQRHHSNVSPPTLRKYARTLVGVLQLIRRSKGSGYPFKTHPPIIKAVDALVSKLTTAKSPAGGFDIDDQAPVEGLELDEHGEPSEDSSSPEDDDEHELGEFADFDELETLLLKVLQLLYTTVPTTSQEVPMHSPVMQYLLISSLRADGAWNTTTSITQKIAGSAFVGRVTFAHLIMDLSRRESITSHEAFDSYKMFLLERSDGIMPHLYLLHRGLAAIQSAEQSNTILSSPSWDADAVTVGEKNLYFHEIASMVRALEREIESGLQDVLFHAEDYLEPIEGQIYDEPHRSVPGFSFLDDERNSWHSKAPLIQYVLETSSVFRIYGTVSEDDSEILWKTDAVCAWMEIFFHLQEKLMVAIVLTYGEPARATELVTNLARNYPGGSIRNLYYSAGTLFLRGSYNKTSFLSGKDKVMARAPLPSISRLFLTFLVYVRPLFSEWQRVIRPKMHHNSHYYLFCGLWRPLTGVDLSKSLVRFTEEYLGVRIPSSLHRQIMAFITSRYRPIFPSGSVSTATDEQLGHSEKMDRKHYGLDGSIPGQMDHESLRLSLEVSGIFHRLLCMDTELLESLSRQHARVAELKSELDGIRHRNSAGQTATGSHSGPRTARVERDSTGLLTSQSVARAVSNFLAPFLSQQIRERVNQANAAIVHLFAPQQITAESTHVPPTALVNTHPSAITHLKDMFPLSDLHGFTTIYQAQATQLAIERSRSFILITPTASGKTLPSLIASKYHDGERTTVWLLPLRSLQEQIKQHCRTHGLDVRVYNIYDTPANSPRNLIVSVEKSTTGNFDTYLRTLSSSNRIARVVFDEAHLVLTHESFRPVMKTLRWLGQKGIQVILLTATLPTHLVPRLVEETGLVAPITLRSSTERPNISIRVTILESGDAVLAKVHETLQEIQGRQLNERTLVFWRATQEAEHFSQHADIPCVHAGLEVDKIESILGQFRSGEVMAISCTTILGVGLDVSEVTHVIHAGLPWNLLGYAQEAGRAGRSRNTPRAWS